jgi:molybdate transport system ATP-binding protein
MAAAPFITLDGISVRVADQRVINALSWQIKTGENWVVWGANGAGKTTLARALLGDAPVVKGRIHRHYEKTPIRIADHSSDSLALISAEQHQDLYRMHQRLDAMAHFSGRLEAGPPASALLDALPGEDQAFRAELVRMLKMEAVLAKPVDVLSAGETRKLLIARALLRHPRLLILDEPFNGLDADSQAQLAQILNRLGRHGVQMVLITHRPVEIPEVFSHLIHLEEGRAQWQGPTRVFFETRKTPSSGAMQSTAAPSVQRLPAASVSDPAPLVRMRDVSVRYGDHRVLEGISWTLRQGEHWALVGPNGAGKSTLLKLITGDNLQGYANELVLFGRPKGSGESVWQIKQQIGYVADDLQLRYQKRMSGLDVVCSGFFDSVGLYRRCTDAQRKAARACMRDTGIGKLGPRLFSALSFGQQRMVLIARAMVKAPRLLILDEPCNGLDHENRQNVLEMLDVIGRRAATSLLVVSHRPEEIPACITHRLQLREGRIHAISPRNQLTARTKDPSRY